MTVYSRNWIGLDGQPLTGLLPSKLLVYGPPGQQLNAGQLGEVAHAFKLFNDAVRVSPVPNGYHVQNRTLRDGSRVRMTSNASAMTTEVWIKGGGDELLYRGFVIEPKFTDEGPTDWPGETTLLAYGGAPPKWRDWVTPYTPGRRGSGPTYFVSSTRSRPLRGIQEEGNFLDVYLWSGKTLHVNGARTATFGSSAAGTLVVLKQTDPLVQPEKIFFSANSLALFLVGPGLPSTLLFSYDPTFPPFTKTYTQPPRHMVLAERIDLEVLGLTIAGLLQVKRAALQLLREPPWFEYTEFSGTVGTTALLYPSGGYTTTEDYIPSSPLFPIRDANALICGWRWNTPAVPELGGATTFNSYIRGTGVGTSNTRNKRTYVKNLSDGASAELYDDIRFSTNRALVINSSRESGIITWGPRWPGPRTWTASVSPGSYSEAALYGQFQSPPADLNSFSIEAGRLISIAQSENGGTLQHLDSSSCVTSSPEFGAIYSAEVEHRVDHTESAWTEWLSNDPGGPRSVGQKGFFVDEDGDGDFDRFVYASWWAYVPCAKDLFKSYEEVLRVEQFIVTASTKDFLFVDVENDVQVWLESTFSGSRTITLNNDSESETGSGTLTLVLHVAAQGRLFSSDTRSFSTSGVTFPTEPPPDISFGSSNLVWRYAALTMPAPIFNPRWLGQGSCPHIAYTVTGEDAPDRLLASFRVQVAFDNRPIGTEPEVLPDTVQFKVPMLEQMLVQHWYGTAYFTVLKDLESEPFVLNASYPGADVHGNLGITGDNPKSEFYRS